MPYSALTYRDLLPDSVPTRATIVTLHGDNGHLDDLVPLARSLGSDLRVVAPEAARGVNNVRDVVAHTWYGGQLDRPEPASFGDSLAQLERFLHDVRERATADEPARPWLLGYDQGAVLALALSVIAPDLLAGAMTVGGCLPRFTDSDLLPPVASDLPVLLIAESAADTPPAAAVVGTADRLTALGARVTTTWLAGARELGPKVSDALQAWLATQLDR